MGGEGGVAQNNLGFEDFETGFKGSRFRVGVQGLAGAGLQIWKLKVSRHAGAASKEQSKDKRAGPNGVYASQQVPREPA